MKQEDQLWEAFLRARQQRHNLYEVSHEFGIFEFDDSVFEYPISDGLKILLGRARELAKDFEQFEEEIELFYQNAAWAYAKSAYNLNKDDQIEVTLDGKTWVVFCESLWNDTSDKHELMVSGCIARKDGSKGKRSESIPLSLADWRVVKRASNQF